MRAVHLMGKVSVLVGRCGRGLHPLFKGRCGRRLLGGLFFRPCAGVRFIRERVVMRHRATTGCLEVVLRGASLLSMVGIKEAGCCVGMELVRLFIGRAFLDNGSIRLVRLMRK